MSTINGNYQLPDEERDWSKVKYYMAETFTVLMYRKPSYLFSSPSPGQTPTVGTWLCEEAGFRRDGGSLELHTGED
jgi:hypothetical protein